MRFLPLISLGLKDQDKQPQVIPEETPQILLTLSKGEVYNNVVSLQFVNTCMPCTSKFILLEKHLLFYYSIGYYQLATPYERLLNEGRPPKAAT